MAKRAAAAATGGGSGPDPKMMTMMRLGEMNCFDEEQRIAIMEMVKDGSMTVAEAQAEVKRTKPKTFSLKYMGSTPLAAQSLTANLSDAKGQEAIKSTNAKLKKTKDIRKVELIVSTVGFRIQDSGTEDTLENEPTSQIAYVSVVPGDKKRVAYVTSYSRLGLVFCHLFQCRNAKEATMVCEAMRERRTLAQEAKSLVPSNAIDRMSAGVDDDEEEDEDDTGAPLGVFEVNYLGAAQVQESQGSAVVAAAVDQIKENLVSQAAAAQPSGSGSRKGSAASSSLVGTPVVLVLSSEGIRTVERHTRDIVHNVIIKAITFSTEDVGKKVELFSFIEVDDRRNSKTCHIFLCEKGVKGQALAICDCLCLAFQRAVDEAKKRAGNPFLPMGRIREKIEGPLAEYQVPRKELTAIKAIGAGQFGKVYLAEQSPTGEEDGCHRAVKMLRGGASQDDRKEFLREAETMLSIGEHTNLVKFIGVSVTQRPWLVVLEFCQYGDLSDVLRACGRKKVKLRLAEQLHFASQLADGMAYIHSKGFVHMDLAARNCLLHEGNQLKVADFGLTHKYDEGQSYYKQIGVLKLSIRWLAIDSFDHKHFSEKSDVWSFGVTLWEIFNYGRQPYTGHKLTQVLRLVRNGMRLEQTDLTPDNVYDVMSSCWHGDRTKRPTFVALRETLAYMATTIGESQRRDIGTLLNKDLAGRIKKLSVRIRKKKSSPAMAAQTAPAIAEGDEDDLTGAVDQEQKAAPEKSTQEISTALEATLAAIPN